MLSQILPPHAAHRRQYKFLIMMLKVMLIHVTRNRKNLCNGRNSTPKNIMKNETGERRCIDKLEEARKYWDGGVR